jgi:uncharacterized phage infection (PIP) family protein YhgE
VFTKSADECSNALQQQNKLLLRLRKENDANVAETTARLTEFDGRCMALETRLAEAVSRQAATVERVLERHERVSQGLESIRLQQDQKKAEMPQVYEQIRELQEVIQQKSDETRDMVHKERHLRDEQAKRTQMQLLQEHSKQISELELKLAARMERESAHREENVREVLDEVRTRTASNTSGKNRSPPSSSRPKSPMSYKTMEAPAPQELTSITSVTSPVPTVTSSPVIVPYSPSATQRLSSGGPPRRMSSMSTGTGTSMVTSQQVATISNVSGSLSFPTVPIPVVQTAPTAMGVPSRQTMPAMLSSWKGASPNGSYKRGS